MCLEIMVAALATGKTGQEQIFQPLAQAEVPVPFSCTEQMFTWQEGIMVTPATGKTGYEGIFPILLTDGLIPFL